MKRLAYGALREHEIEPLAALLVRRPDLRILSVDGLSLAVSRLPEDDAAPDLARLRAYAETVDGLHRHATTLPLRYGCVLDSDAEFEALVHRNQRSWKAALDEVEGCDEIGVRIALDLPGPDALQDCSPAAGGELPAGIRYLEARRRQFAAKDAFQRRVDGAAERLRNELHGLFRKSRIANQHFGGRSWLSLAFLVRRDQLAPFRGALDRMNERGNHEVILTGPWPPYHFVDRDPETARASAS